MTASVRWPWFVADRTDLTARLPALRQSTLVLYGDRDPLCPEPVARFLAERIPRATCACIPGGDHAMAHDRAGDVAPLIRSHLTRPGEGFPGTATGQT